MLQIRAPSQASFGVNQALFFLFLAGARKAAVAVAAATFMYLSEFRTVFDV